jgi:hypothetical protein
MTCNKMRRIAYNPFNRIRRLYRRAIRTSPARLVQPHVPAECAHSFVDGRTEFRPFVALRRPDESVLRLMPGPAAPKARIGFFALATHRSISHSSRSTSEFKRSLSRNKVLVGARSALLRRRPRRACRQLRQGIDSSSAKITVS